MKLLAIESATEAFSVAININGELKQLFEISPRNHSKKLLNMVDKIAAETNVKLQQLDAIAFGAGPGSFTGVRIATGIAQGLAFSADLPLIPMSTLASLSQLGHDKYNKKFVIPSIDARMNQVYWGAYKYCEQKKIMQAIINDEISNPEKINLPDTNIAYMGIGTGWNYKSFAKDQLTTVVVDSYPDAKSLAKLAAIDWQNNNLISPEQATPVYLRNKVALTKTEQQSN